MTHATNDRATALACWDLQDHVQQALRAGRIPVGFITCGPRPRPEPLHVQVDRQALACALQTPEAAVRSTEATVQAWTRHLQEVLAEGRSLLGLAIADAEGRIHPAAWGDALQANGVTTDRFRTAVKDAVTTAVEALESGGTLPSDEEQAECPLREPPPRRRRDC